ncbi:MAG: 23S rRNA (uracil(1939)-C(5))-methyltransferase RlmD [Candidatus Marinimicrobia bacterium]|nr:23S rRNA (uracil(1939)-C(5))-methyltransferase RlmD [Candidatus Neomarinimicrobiota bacterium]
MSVTQTDPVAEAAPALPQKGAQVELTIDSLAYGGQGVARHEGFVVFVAKGAVPGERVLALITRRRKGFAEARVLEVLTPSPAAAQPDCAHFGVCGGCASQNYRYDQQLAQKQAQVVDLFTRMGRFENPDVRPIIGCEQTYHYRNKMEFTFSNHAWVLNAEDIDQAPSRALGLHVPGRYDKVLDIDACSIQHPVGNEILQLVKSRAAQLKLEPYDIKTHRGFLRYLVIRVAGEASNDLQVMVNLVTSREATGRLKPLVDDLVAAFPQVVSVVNNINTKKAGIALGEWEVLLHGKSTITEQLRGFAFDISANSFFQTNTRQAEVLYDQIEKACALTGDEVVYDLYCGTGTITLALAGHARELAGFESVSSAVDDAARNAMLNEVFNVRFFSADLSSRYFTQHEKRLTQQIGPPDIIVADPPRAGMHPKLIDEIVALSPRKVVYVSCNPATQVRDVRLLCEGGYELRYLQPVDMFPHTPHVENICVMERS